MDANPIYIIKTTMVLVGEGRLWLSSLLGQGIK
ncbi:hypothetical protein BCE_1058 [Bacillus cereus ATCC 10987]|uniref:Uncharacterized protein n=1 Tax=Bacillus cereus (strain ATCC 10987 / NRS 248) TaxID=222523 RepID=Q73CK7_BACC1|nr:hypothetical protein BCE_1058 [Bacillus cereus ATCC 10987]